MDHNPGYTTTEPAETPMSINQESSPTIIIGKRMFSEKFKAADTSGRTGGLIRLYVGDKSED